MPLKLALVRSIIYIFFLFKSAEKCQFQNTRKVDASPPLYYPEWTMLNQNLLLQFFKIRTKLFTPKVEKNGSGRQQQIL